MMEKIVTGQEEEPAPRDDQGVAEELESLYCRVARLDQEDYSGGESGDPLPGKAQAPIRPAASPRNRCQMPLCREELEERLDSIADTYEEILSLRPSASEHPPAPLPGETCPETVNGEAERNGISGSAAGYSPFRRYPWAVGAAATTVVIVFVFLVWPTLYRYDSLIPQDPASQAAVNARPVPGRPIMPPPEGTSSPLSVPGPAEGNAGPPSPRRGESLPKPITPPLPAVSVPDKGGMPPPVSSKAPSSAVKVPPRRERGYSIQIRAFRSEQDARSFAEAVKKTEPEIHIETILLEGNGVWHRVLMGDFKTENEALEYYTMKKTKELFPGSFIRGSQR